MAKKPLDTEELLPLPKDITTTGKEVYMNEVNKMALRRGKVRELMRMGYGPSQIVLILEKGIKINKDEIVKVPLTEKIVKDDMEYIRQEDAAISIDFPEKRAELIDKLNFLYQRSILEYTNAKGAVKNNFLNTALNVLGKIIEIEGIKSPEAVDININAQAKLTKFAAEIHALNKEDRDALVKTIHTILAKRSERGAIEGLGVPSDTSGIPVSSSDDEGVSGKS